MQKSTKIFWQLSRFSALALGLLATLYALLPYPRLKSLVDSLASDGTLELFDTALYANTRLVALALGLLLLAFFLLLTLLREKTLGWYESALNTLRRFPALLLADRKRFWTQAKAYLSQDRDWLILLGFILLGAFFRLQLLDKPVYHDEAYAYLGFVKGGFLNVISDYHQPNNHILFTIGMFFATRLFGIAPWVLRLPAFLTGLLLIPATYFAARQAFNRATGVLTSGIVAIFPIFSVYATSARGYAQFALFTTLMWLWALLLLKQKNRYLWLLFILSALAGFYTMPTMVYPYTAMMGWLFFMWLFKKYSPAYSHKTFFVSLFLSGVVVVVLFILLYTPIFLNTGASSVFNNVTIQKQQIAEAPILRDTIRSRAFRSWEEWHTGMPIWLMQVSQLGVFLGLLYTCFVKKQAPSYFVVSLLVFLALIFVQRAMGWTRVWFFFAPVYFSFAAGGIIWLLQLLFRKKADWLLPSIGIMLVAAALVTFAWWQTPSREIREMRGAPTAVERGILYLESRLTPSDAIQTHFDYTPQMQYYAEYYGIPIEQTHPANNQFTSLYVIWFLPDVPLAETLHGGTRDRVDLSANDLVYEDRDLKIYKIPIVIFYDE